MTIHPCAYVSSTAKLGRGVTIWQFASVIRGAVIGDRSSVGSCAIVDAAHVGERCSIGHGAFIGPGSLLDDDVFVAPNVTICNDAWPSTQKDGFALSDLLDGSIITVRVCDRASLGAGSVVLPGVTVGVGAVVAAGATVDRSLPPDCLFKRNGSIVRLDPTIGQRRMRTAP